MEDIEDVHHFIKDACHKLYLLESYSADNAGANINGFEQVNSDDECEAERPDPKNGLFNESLLQHIMIKRNDIFHCAECKYESSSYTTFYNHCMSAHQKHNNVSDGNAAIYRCIKCCFLTLNFNGFKIHCSTKHKCLPHDALQTVSWNNPNAEFYFQQFTQVAEGSKQKKHAMKLLKFYFRNKQKHLDFVSEKHEIVEDKDQIVGGSLKEELQCRLCDFKCQCVYFLEEHYHSNHDANGPERDSSDNQFHCTFCIFKTASYKKLHVHHKTYHMNKETSLEKDVEQENTYMPESPPPSLDQQSASDCVRYLQCHLCKYVTSNVCALLNHWRSTHPRDYPPFAAQRVYDDYKENVFEVNLPLKTVERGWLNGWMNENCTGLYKKPLYHCSQCTYVTLLRNSIHKHYATMHPHIPSTNNTLCVTESPTVNNSDLTKRIYEKSTMFQCSRCSEFTTCFFKDMLNHYKLHHENILQELSECDLDSEIANSVVTRCFKCLDFYCNDALVLLEHYICDHAIRLPTFSLQKDEENFLAVCKFCNQTFTNLKQLCEHLEFHRKEQVKRFKKQHLVAYCCSKCRRVFRHQRSAHGHYTRWHFKWNETDFTYDDIPSEFFTNKPDKLPDVAEQEQNDVSASPTPEPVILPSSCFPEKSCNDEMSDKFSDEHSLCSKRSNSTLVPFSCVCYICAIEFNSLAGLQRHLKRNHQIQASMSSIKSKLSQSTDRTLYSTCSHQSYVDKNPKMYKRHVETLHNEGKPHECPHCNKSYICEVVLRMHVRKKHKFSNFGKAKIPLAPIGNLVKTKIPLTPTLYTSCAFKRLVDVKPLLYQRHVSQKHSEKAPYHCPKCNRAYICKSVFLVHVQRKHKLQLNERRLRKCQQFVSDESIGCAGSTAHAAQISEVSHVSRDSDNKDYRHAKSVRTREGQWKCLFCRKMLPSYLHLRRHCMKDHANHRMMKCRWCDYVCRTNVQLSNHLKIHNKFISQRMKILREICRSNRQTAIMKGRKTLSSKLTGEAMQIDVISPTSSVPKPSDSPKPTGKAKKSIRPGFFGRKTIPKARKEIEKSSTNSRHYFVTEHGIYRCRLCSFMSAEKTRLIWHLNSAHVNGKVYKCKLCFFQHNEFDQMHTHLSLHHKMERNHQLAVELSVAFGGESRMEQGKDAAADEPYVPSNSLPIMEVESRDSSIVDMEASESEQEQEPGSMGSRPIEINDDLSFKCSYCAARLKSSYEAECHMIRHERCRVSATEIDESAIAFAKFTSFLQPL